ncbi:MAG TPA: hypothetical protein VGM03_19505 [Phycisphaerae bacterium]
MDRAHRWRATPALLGMMLAPVAAAQSERERIFAPLTASAESTAAEPAVKPRLELHVGSVSRLISEFGRSHAGVFAEQLGRTFQEVSSLSSEGLAVESAAGLFEIVQTWPDTSIDFLTFSPDSRGRSRWAVRLDWPVSGLQTRMAALLRAEAAGKLFKGARLTARAAGGHELTIGDATIAYLLPAGDARSCLTSHPDLNLPATVFVGTEGDEPALLGCRLNFAGTEINSGALFSSFHFVTSIDYTARVGGAGDWIEEVQVQWPPLSGLGAKALLDKVKQTFFVPDEAFGALAISTPAIGGMLDGLAGLGPQMVPDESGGFAMVAAEAGGVIARHAGADVCVSLIPGTGFIPMPDIAIQTRVKQPEKFLNEVREAARKINEEFRHRDQSPPWHEATIKERCVFWNEGSSGYGGGMMPVSFRPVVFTAREVDASGKDRDLLVLAWTSTSPQRFVTRWLELPRGDKRRFLPSAEGTYGQAWLNWKTLYAWVHPYLNLALSAFVRDALLPRTREIAGNLTDGDLTLKVRYTGLNVAHRGPIPVGALLVPALAAIALDAGDAGGSDIARERVACQRLEVLYHHCQLFKRDTGRWPATLAELDGYVDFSGHPELLHLTLSPKRQWAQWLEGIQKRAEKKTEESEDESPVVLDEKLYVIEWRPERWTLGYAPGTLDHLEKLYIDQDGQIHRVEKTPAEQAKTSGAGHDSASTSGTSSQE